jgi:hypothetical protein
VTWAIYGLLLVVAVVLLLLPEPDFALVTKNTWPAAAPARRASHTRCRDRRRPSRLSRQARCEQQVGAQPPPGTASARPEKGPSAAPGHDPKGKLRPLTVGARLQGHLVTFDGFALDYVEVAAGPMTCMDTPSRAATIWQKTMRRTCLARYPRFPLLPA